MRVVIAEDAAVIRAGLVQLLTDCGVEVAAAVGDADALVEAVDRERPDAVVADVRMPPGFRDEGVRAAAELRERHPGLGVLLFSQYVEGGYADRLLAGGAAGLGYLLKERVADVDEFLDALHRVAAGGTALDPEVVSRLLAARRGGPGLDALTARERTVLEQMAQGRANAAIAEALGVSVRAVEKHVAGVFAKLGLDRADGDHPRVLAVLRFLREG